MPSPHYSILDHTADLGIEVHGSTLPELFSSGGDAFTDLLTQIDQVTPKQRREIEVRGSGHEELFVRWLSELLFFFDAEKLLFSEFEVIELSDQVARIRVGGEPFDRHRHPTRNDIKAVTYHGVEIVRVGEGWRARVIFDI